MPTENERNENKELQRKIEEKLSKKFGHAIPQIDRNRPIENNFDFKPIEREKLENPLKDIDIDEYLLWKAFNNRNERQLRVIDTRFIDEPGISNEEIASRLSYNREALKRNTLEQLEKYPEMFKGLLHNDSDS